MQAKLTQLLEATWDNPVFGDTFPKDDLQRMARVLTQLKQIAKIATPNFTACVRAALPRHSQQDIQKIVHDVFPKTLAFVPALLEGKLDDLPRLTAEVLAVSGMYWADQSMDRNDPWMEKACKLLPTKQMQEQPIPQDAQVLARYKATTLLIDKNVRKLARPEDVPFVVNRFYGDVLQKEVTMQELSRAYLGSDQKPAFIAAHARQLAEISTIDAGFPSITDSLYAIYRHHHSSLPPLAEIDADPGICQLLQVCNVVARLWDELGDWHMDTGHNPNKGVFVINPCNEYDPAFIQRFLELGSIQNPRQIRRLQHAFANFHASDDGRKKHIATITEILRLHAKKYVAGLPVTLLQRYQLYIDLCKRVLEISYVNRIGDISLATPNE